MVTVREAGVAPLLGETWSQLPPVAVAVARKFLVVLAVRKRVWLAPTLPTCAWKFIDWGLAEMLLKVVEPTWRVTGMVREVSPLVTLM